MRIAEVLLKIKNMKPSQYDDDMLVSWLSELDGHVWEELLAKYGAPAPVLPYNGQMLNRMLLIPFPYDGIYLVYLAAQIDYHNAEFERYNNGMMLFNAQLQAFYDSYTRNHKTEKALYIEGVKAL